MLDRIISGLFCLLFVGFAVLGIVVAFRALPDFIGWIFLGGAVLSGTMALIVVRTDFIR